LHGAEKFRSFQMVEAFAEQLREQTGKHFDDEQLVKKILARDNIITKNIEQLQLFFSKY